MNSLERCQFEHVCTRPSTFVPRTYMTSRRAPGCVRTHAGECMSMPLALTKLPWPRTGNAGTLLLGLLSLSSFPKSCFSHSRVHRDSEPNLTRFTARKSRFNPARASHDHFPRCTPLFPRPAQCQTAA